MFTALAIVTSEIEHGDNLGGKWCTLVQSLLECANARDISSTYGNGSRTKQLNKGLVACLQRDVRVRCLPEGVR
jgi:hypothetical protein